MEESTKNGSIPTNTIPTSLLIDLFNEQRQVFESHRALLNKMQDPATQPPASETDIERMAGQVQARADVLTSLMALLMVRSADAAGQLEPFDR